MTAEPDTLAPFLAAALKEEFSFMAGPMASISGSDDTWLKAANGVIAKMQVKLSEKKLNLPVTPKPTEIDFSLPELELITYHLQAMGWDYLLESRAMFLERLRKEAPPKEGDVCPVHHEVHGAHGWYWCDPDGKGFWETKAPGGPVVWTPNETSSED